MARNSGVSHRVFPTRNRDWWTRKLGIETSKGSPASLPTHRGISRTKASWNDRAALAQLALSSPDAS